MTELVDLLAPVVAVLAAAAACGPRPEHLRQLPGPPGDQDPVVVVHVAGAEVLAAGIAEHCAVARTRTSATSAAHSAGPAGWAVPLAEAERILAVARRWQHDQPQQVLRIDVRPASIQITGPAGQLLLVARRPPDRAAAAHIAGGRMHRVLAVLDAAAAERAPGTSRGPALRIMQRHGGRGRAVYGDGVLGLVVERESR